MFGKFRKLLKVAKKYANVFILFYDKIEDVMNKKTSSPDGKISSKEIRDILLTLIPFVINTLGDKVVK